jgi:hypothetical protein
VDESRRHDEPDELADFEERTVRTWNRASLSALRIVIDLGGVS